MSSAWYYQRDGRQFGPVSAAELRRLAHDGQLGPHDRVRRTDSDRWYECRKVDGLFDPLDTPTKTNVTNVPQVQSSPAVLAQASGISGRTVVAAVAVTAVVVGVVIGALTWLFTTEHKAATLTISPATSPLDIKTSVVANETSTEPTRVPDTPTISEIRPRTPSELFQDVSQAVVRVVSLDGDGKPISQGSGFFVSTDGLVVTNFHVIEGAAAVRTQLYNNTYLEVTSVAAVSESDDIALLSTGAKGVPSLKLRDEGLPDTGTKVFAIGTPKGLANSLSDGLISGVREIAPGNQVLQTTTPISPGSSGGPLLDDQGTVVGVTTFYIGGGQNLNFAVPSATVARIWKAASSPQPLETVTGFEPKSRPKSFLQDRLERDLPFQARVAFTISADETIRPLVESYFLRELRKYGDIVITSDEPLFSISVVVLPQESVYGKEIFAYYLSCVIFHHQQTAEDDRVSRGSAGSVESHVLMLRGKNVLEEGVRELIAEFNSEQLEVYRRVYDGLLLEKQRLQRQNGHR